MTVENDVVAILDRSNSQQRRSRRVLDAGTISNDLAGWIAADLPGLDAVTFERVARRRVVVAVPFEAEPDRTWGHVPTFSAADLVALAAATGRPYRVEEHHGGRLTRTP